MQLIKITLFIFLIILLSPFLNAQQQASSLKIVSEYQTGTFPLVQKNIATDILIDAADAEVVSIVAKAIAGDIEQISSAKPNVITTFNNQREYLIIAGTVGHSALIDQLVKNQKLDISGIQNKWESFTITIINAPIKGVKQALVIAGSDRRGTAYGLFEISRQAGVSPWVWWADVVPEQHKSLYVTPGTMTSDEPSVKYRGIFLNDEDWGLQPWAAKNMDPDIKDIGPKTYAHIFELLLRLRANFIWPAMHDCTKAYYYYPENPKVADRYAIVVGSSHCEPMLRNNVFEWKENFENEYSAKPNDWRYDLNKSQIFRYWDDRVKASRNYESVYTVGMRGIHDGGMPGPKTAEGKLHLMDTVIQDQRGIFQHYFGKAEKVPQLFCPYKEVLDIYRNGLKIPEDVTLLWPDDNHGYIRQLSTPEEQKRSGHSGVYYHLSYWGVPHDYLWLSTLSPSLISFEMTKAFQFGADKLWVLNVGDIKPSEMETQFFMDLAWNVNRWTPEKAHEYAQTWAEQTFGKDLAPDISAIKTEYFRLAQNAKPEHLRMLRFDSDTKKERLAAYSSLVEKLEKVKQQIPARLQNAFFQLLEYPVKGAALMNQKIFYAEMSMDLASKKNPESLELAKKSKDAFEQIKSLTEYYNTGIENGKWNGIMSYAPRKLAVFNMPKVATEEMVNNPAMIPSPEKNRYIDSIPGISVEALTKSGRISLSANNFKTKHEIANEKLDTMEGLGLGGKSISRYPFTGLSFKKENYSAAPYLEYFVKLKAGKYSLSLKCLPAQAICAGRSLRMAVSVDNQEPQFVDVNHSKEDRIWSVNVIHGYSEAIIPVNNDKDGDKLIRIYLLDTGLALSRIDISESGMTKNTY